MKSFKIYLMAVLAVGLMACNNAQENGSNAKTASNNSP